MRTVAVHGRVRRRRGVALEWLGGGHGRSVMRGGRRTFSSVRLMPRRLERSVMVCSLEERNEPGGAAAEDTEGGETIETIVKESPGSPEVKRRLRKREADSTDWIASALTRRFGLAGGLAWLGVLAFGVISEQIKTRLEVRNEEVNTKEVIDAPEETLASGVVYKDVKIGGGARPVNGDIVLLNFRGYMSTGTKFYDTYDAGKPILFVFGSRPFAGGMCLGVEETLKTMRAGGKRYVRVPADQAFASRGVTLRPSRHVSDKDAVVPPDENLIYELELVRVSIAPS